MPPTEASILSNFLLTPAPLPCIISLRKFTELFPRSHRTSPYIQELYHALQHQRAIDVDNVKRNIALEAQRGEKQKREVIKARHKVESAELEGMDLRETQVEAEVDGLLVDDRSNEPYTLNTINPEIERACAYMEANVAKMETEASDQLSRIKAVVNELSDLRYGRLSQSLKTGVDLCHDLVDGLRRLQTICEASQQS